MPSGCIGAKQQVYAILTPLRAWVKNGGLQSCRRHPSCVQWLQDRSFSLRRTLQMNRQHRHICRRNATDAKRLPQTSWRELHQLLASLVAQPLHACVVDALWNQFVFHPRESLDLLILPANVSLILGANLDESADRRINRR